MINGVEVLTSEMVRVSADFDELTFMGVLFTVSALLLFYLFTICVKENFNWLALVCIVTVFLFALGAGRMFKMAINPVYEEHYMVQLKEEVPVKFLQDYEFVEDKGNGIYIVREKGNN